MLLIFELFWGRCRTADREHAAKFQESGLTLDYTPGCSFYRGASRRWFLSAAYRVWDSNSARSEGS